MRFNNAATVPLPEAAVRFTVHRQENGTLAFTCPDGCYLTCAPGGGLLLTEEMAQDDLSLWTLEPAYGGWNIVSAGDTGDTGTRLAVEYYLERFNTYRLDNTSE